MTDKELKQYKVYLKAAEKRYEEINTLKRKLNASYGTAEHMFGITDIYVERIKKRLADDKKATKGYLKNYTYKEACANWWSKLTEENKEIIMSIPNFDADKCEEITGIKID